MASQKKTKNSKKKAPKKNACYHCGEIVKDKAHHDCWTTTELALTGELSQDLLEAWRKLRMTATGFGKQRIYASHQSIMFSRRHCYFFVRPKKNFLEVCFFLPRTVNSPSIRNAKATSKTKVAHIVQIRHLDEIEAPLTDWLYEAFENCPPLALTESSMSSTSG